MRGMTPKPYHHGNLRSALIEAGLAALEKTESGDVSLRALARDIGVSANAAYRHFEDKDALLSALAAEGFRRFDAGQTAAIQSHSDRLAARRATGRAYIDFARANPALFRLMFGHFLHGKVDDDLRQAAMVAFQSLLAASALETGADTSDERTLRMAIMRWGLVHGLSHLMLDGQLDFFSGDPSELIDDVLAMSSQIAEAARRLPEDQVADTAASQAGKTGKARMPAAKRPAGEQSGPA